jgi:hypothetical protein
MPFGGTVTGATLSLKGHCVPRCGRISRSRVPVKAPVDAILVKDPGLLIRELALAHAMAQAELTRLREAEDEEEAAAILLLM